MDKSCVKSVNFSNPAPENIWYLPHHPVTNPNKSGKIKRIANAPYGFKKFLLNKNFLSGCDLLNNLVLSFRHFRVAVIADIEAMFMQTFIRTANQSCYRFVWPTKKSIQQFQHTCLIFGAKFTPTTALYMLQQTAKDFGSTA